MRRCVLPTAFFQLFYHRIDGYWPGSSCFFKYERRGGAAKGTDTRSSPDGQKLTPNLNMDHFSGLLIFRDQLFQERQVGLNLWFVVLGSPDVDSYCRIPSPIGLEIFLDPFPLDIREYSRVHPSSLS